MSKLRSLLALLVVATLAVMGCGDDDASTDDAATDASAETASPDDSDETVNPDDAETGAPEIPDIEPFEEPDGPAATVGGTEIATDVVETIFGDVSQSPQLAEQLDGDQGEIVAASLRAQVLTELVVYEILAQAAEDDFGVTVSGDELDAGLTEMEDEAGGGEELDAQLEGSGLTRDAFVEIQLPLIVLLQQLEPEFGDLSSDPDAEDPSQLSEGQMALQEWGTERFGDAEVTIADEYGTWNAEAARVLPVGSPPPPSIEE